MIDYGYGVRLQYVSESDTEDFFKWRNDERVWKWCRQNGPLTKKHHKTYWEKCDDDESIKMYAIYTTEGLENVQKDSLVGCAGLTSIDNVNSRAEFSIYINPDIASKGFGERALKTLFSYGYQFLNLNSVWGESFEENPALKTFTKIGMKEEGKRRAFYYRKGQYIGATLISLLRSEWDTLKSGW